jgi:hypothetical protein
MAKILFAQAIIVKAESAEAMLIFGKHSVCGPGTLQSRKPSTLAAQQSAHNAGMSR